MKAEPMKMCDKSSEIKVFSQNAKLELLFSPELVDFKWPYSVLCAFKNYVQGT